MPESTQWRTPNEEHTPKKLDAPIPPHERLCAAHTGIQEEKPRPLTTYRLSCAMDAATLARRNRP